MLFPTFWVNTVLWVSVGLNKHEQRICLNWFILPVVPALSSTVVSIFDSSSWVAMHRYTAFILTSGFFLGYFFLISLWQESTSRGDLQQDLYGRPLHFIAFSCTTLSRHSSALKSSEPSPGHPENIKASTCHYRVNLLGNSSPLTVFWQLLYSSIFILSVGKSEITLSTSFASKCQATMDTSQFY